MRRGTGIRNDAARLAPRGHELGFGAAVCADDGRVIFANGSFHRLASEGDGVRLDLRGCITASNPRHTDVLRSAIAGACNPAGPGEYTTTWLSLERPSGSTALIAAVEPTTDSFRQIGGSGGHALLLLIDPDREAACSTEALEVLGRLTAAEIEVCNLLLRGCSTREIAAERNVALDTVRCQIKTAMAKLSCHTRADLIRLATSSHAPYLAAAPAS